jgi:hypothetical protein
MTNTREFIESRLLVEISNRKNMEDNYLQDGPISTSQLKDYYKLQGFIDALKFILNADLGKVGFHYHMTGLGIEDVLASLEPGISGHKSGCTCHECITNDVLQDYIKNERGLHERA